MLERKHFAYEVLKKEKEKSNAFGESIFMICGSAALAATITLSGSRSGVESENH